MYRYLEDLRFVIGLFFAVVGVILIATGLIEPRMVSNLNINLDTGICFLIWGTFMLFTSIRDHRQENR